MPSNRFATHSSRFEEKVSFYLGVSMAQGRGSTGLAIVRRRRNYEWFGSPKDPVRRLNSDLFELGHIERMFDARYPAIAAHVTELAKRPEWRDNIEVIVDHTDTGRPACDAFEATKIQIKRIAIITGDAEVREAHDTYRVPRLQLISALQALFHEQRFAIQKHLPDAQILARELLDHRIATTDSGRAHVRARDGGGDDLVRAVAVAIWGVGKDYESKTTELRI